MLTPEQRNTLVDNLLKVPPALTFDGRTTLLSGIQHTSLNRNPGSALLDLQMIVDQLVTQRAREQLILVIDNALRYALGTEIARNLGEVKAALNKPDAPPAPPPPPAPPAPPASVRAVAISFAEQDKALARELEGHLKGLVTSGALRVWHRGHIPPGAITEEVAARELAGAQIIVLLVTADYIASPGCLAEARAAVAQHKSGQSHVFPVQTRACAWYGMPFEKMQALPEGKRPVNAWSDRNEAWTQVVDAIVALLPPPAGG